MAMLAGANLSATYASLGEGNTPQIGDVYFGPLGKIYKFVQYKAGTAAAAGVLGEAAYYYTLDGYKLNQVTSDLSDSIELGAGILQSSPADSEYCWVQIKGPATMSIAFSGADGDPLTPTGSADGTLDVVLNDAGSGFLAHICAYAGDASDNEIICDFPF